MMQTHDFSVSRIQNFNFVETAASGGDKRIYSNDQHVRRGQKCLRPLLADLRYSQLQPSLSASAEPGAARRDQITVPFRLHGALLQHPAGRRGFVAMPAEEHVEPFIELPERGARGGSACGRDRQAGRHRGAESRGSRRRNTQRRRKPPNQRLQRAPAAGQPSSAQISAIRSACRSDYPKVCAGVRPAARRPCNAWKKTRRNSRPVARKPFPPPAAVVPQRLRPRQARLRPQRERLPPLHRRRRP